MESQQAISGVAAQNAWEHTQAEYLAGIDLVTSKAIQLDALLAVCALESGSDLLADHRENLLWLASDLACGLLNAARQLPGINKAIFRHAGNVARAATPDESPTSTEAQAA